MKIIVPNVIRISELKHQYMHIKEGENLNSLYTKIKYFYFYRGSIKYLPNETIRFLFPYDISNPETKICSFEYLPHNNLNYFYILIDTDKPFDITIGTTKYFSDIFDFYNYYFLISGAKRFQRLNFTITAKCTEFYPLNKFFIAEYLNKTNDYENYITKSSIPNYNFQRIDEEIYILNFTYDIQKYPTIALFINFVYDLYNLSINIEAAGGEILFDDNTNTKNISNMKANNPYYFFTKTTQYQTSLITLITNYTKNFPFDYVEIYLYKNKSDTEYAILKGQLETKKDLKNNELIITSSYQTNSSDVTDIGFKLIPKFDLDFIFAKIDIMGGVYYINEDGFIQKFYNVHHGYDLSFWIKSEQNQRTIIRLKYNLLEENPLKNLHVYEYNNTLETGKYYEHTINNVYPTRIKKKGFHYTDAYTTKNEETKFILLKINPDEFLQFLEVKIYIHKAAYDLDNNIPLKINLINRGHQFNFFIKADIYNQIFINFFFDFNKTKPFQYITINEYENRKNKIYTQSSNQTFEMKKSSNENESLISLSYKPINPRTKYIAVVLEPSAFFNYLVTKVNIGGGYYEFDKNKNISKLIAGTVYYFPIKISPLQKIEMNINVFDDNFDINKNPFTYANIMKNKIKKLIRLIHFIILH